MHSELVSEVQHYENDTTIYVIDYICLWFRLSFVISKTIVKKQ